MYNATESKKGEGLQKRAQILKEQKFVQNILMGCSFLSIEQLQIINSFYEEQLKNK